MLLTAELLIYLDRATHLPEKFGKEFLASVVFRDSSHTVSSFLKEIKEIQTFKPSAFSFLMLALA
jgi:hypothetical protein